MVWVEPIRRSYRARHQGRDSQVELNDAIFALHATAITAVTLMQVVYYDWQSRRNRPSWMCVIGVLVTLGVMGAYALAVWVELASGAGGGEEHTGFLTWLDYLYFLSYIKVGISVIKYIPQVALNIRRRSTVGWNIWNVILDFTGGTLSILQLVLDCYNTDDWSGILGYPVKFALGFVSIFFDLIFMVQHYLVYPEHRHGGGGACSVCRPLLFEEESNGEGEEESVTPVRSNFSARYPLYQEDQRIVSGLGGGFEGGFGCSSPPSRPVTRPPREPVFSQR
ncbi:unnamed protein product [Discosporangium mesarthrocarpum]